MKVYSIILAGGIGERIGHHIAKQFIKVAGKSVLEHTIIIFENHPKVDEIIIVIHKHYKKLLEEILLKNNFKKVSKILTGGDTRRESSYIGVNSIEDEEAMILIHDAVRPFLSDRIIDECIQALESYNAVDVAIPASDTIIQVNESMKLIENIPYRKYMWRGQTPQAFKLSTIKSTHKLAMKNQDGDTFSDDCGLVLKYLGEHVYIVQGEEKNIKITHVEDIYLADKLFQVQSINSPKHPKLEQLNNKVIVIFGGTSGIGKSIADIAMQYGAKIYSYTRDTGVDISNYKQVQNALRDVYQKEKKIDYVVNTAAILRMGKLGLRKINDVLYEINVNYIGSVNVSKASIKYLKESRGKLLLFTSSSYTRGRALYSIYSSSKAAVVNLVQALSEELAIDGIKINAICPERTATPMRLKSFGKELPETLLDPSHVALASLKTLLSDISGSVIDVKIDKLKNNA